MEKEQMIKALECCTSGRACRECDFKDKSKDTFGCRKQLLIDALALIKELTEENTRLSFFNEQKTEAVRYEAITKYKKSIMDYYNNDSRYDRPQAHTLLIRLFALLDEKAKEVSGESEDK